MSSVLCSRLEVYRAGRTGVTEDDLVCPGPNGQVLGPRNLLRSLYRVFDELGWPERDHAHATEECRRFHWHVLRHYAISTRIAAGLGLKAVQTYAGHSDVKMTWDTYGHLFPDDGHWDKIEQAAALAIPPI